MEILKHNANAPHGEPDGGAVGVSGVVEKDINLAIGKMLKEALEKENIQVVLTRDKDEMLAGSKSEDMKERVKIMNDTKPVLVVSVHQNSYVTEQESGAQVFYYKQSEEGKKLAGIIQKNMIKELDNTNKRVEKPDSAYYMLRNTQVPTVIVECGFLSNREEAYKLNNDEYQQKTAYSIYCGIIEYLGQN